MSASIVSVSTLSVAAFSIWLDLYLHVLCTSALKTCMPHLPEHIFSGFKQCSLLTKKDHVSYIRPVFVYYEKKLCKFACKYHLLYHFGLTFYVLTDKPGSKSEVIERRSSLDLLVKCWLYNYRSISWACHGHNYRERQFKLLDAPGL